MRRIAAQCLFLLVVSWLCAACTSSSLVSTTESGGSPQQAVSRSTSNPDAAIGQHPGPQQPGLAAVVTKIVDGDTIIVRVQGQVETIRLLGIDTPEKAGGPRPAECFGAEASTRLAELLPVDTPILLSRDQETRDQYSRLLAFVHRSSDGLFVNLSMVQDGYAVPLFFAPNRAAQDQFTAAGDAARRNWVGFWPACGAPDIVLQE